jgi:hypothetical protein
MNKIVSIFGGFRTKQSYYKHAIEVYKSNGYMTNFYANKNLNLCIPKRYIKNVNYAYNNDTMGTIIHTNSGGFWTSLDYLAKITDNKLFICEAGPVEPNSKSLIYILEQIYNFKCPGFISNNINKLCEKIGIPYDEDTEWNMKYHKNLKCIQNFVCLTSKNDKIINNDYINNIITTINNDNRIAKRYDFDSGAHWNISKNETQKYQDILQQHLDKIVKP